MPQYGPSTDDEMIADGLEWAYAVLLARDEMNAAVHCGPVRLSDVTVRVRTALGLWRARLADRSGDDPEIALRAWLDQRGKQDADAVAEAIAGLAASLAAESN